MFGPPFTPTRLVISGLFAVLACIYFALEIRRQWRNRQERRQFAQAGGLRGQRPFNRRRLATSLFIFCLIAGAVAYSCFEQFGSPQTRSNLRTLATRIDTVFKGVMIVLGALVALGILLLLITRDRTLPAVAKLALAGNHTEAEALLRRAIQEKGESERRLTALGVLLMEQNRLDESLAAFESARRLARRPATAMNNAALALKKLGRLDEARQLFDDALRLEPNHFIALTNSCLLLAEMGHETEAFDRLNRAEEIYARYDPSHVKPWKPLLEECRRALPRSHGFPITQPPPV